MKKLIILSTIMLISYIVSAQDKLHLNNYKGKEIFFKVSNNKAHINIGSESRHYELTNERGVYTLADKTKLADLYAFLSLDTNEVATQLSNAFPKMSVADMLINKAGAANATDGIIIKPGDTDILPTEQIIDEEGGRVADPTSTEASDDSSMDWLWYVLPAIATLLIGFILGKNTQRKQPEATRPLLEDNSLTADEPQEEIIINDAADIAKAKEKIKTLQSDKRKLNASLKSTKEELTTAKQEAEKQSKFQAAYYNHAMKELVIPFANAATNGDKKTMVELAFKMVAQYSSKARYEVQNKQPYDTINIANLLQQQIEQGNIPVINAAFPNDQVPNYIRNIISIMESYDAHNLGSTVMMGYKIAK